MMYVKHLLHVRCSRSVLKVNLSFLKQRLLLYRVGQEGLQL